MEEGRRTVLPKKINKEHPKKTPKKIKKAKKIENKEKKHLKNLNSSTYLGGKNAESWEMAGEQFYKIKSAKNPQKNTIKNQKSPKKLKLKRKNTQKSEIHEPTLVFRDLEREREELYEKQSAKNMISSRNSLTDEID
jgi:hypothetical protein